MWMIYILIVILMIAVYEVIRTQLIKRSKKLILKFIDWLRPRIASE